MQKQNVSIEIVVRDKLYIDKKFIEDPTKLKALVQYVKKMQPIKQSLDHAIELLKFFSFPITICFESLYQKISELPVQDIQEFKEKLKEIGAYVKSLLLKRQLDGLPELQFFMRWGTAKKKYKMGQLCEQQINFANFVRQISQKHKLIQERAKNKQYKKDNQVLIRQFLSITDSKKANFLQENYIQEMKIRCTKAINQIQEIEQESQQFSLQNVQKPKNLIFQQKNFKILKNQKIYSNKKQGQTQTQRIPICCRTFFYEDQVIQQPQSLRIEYKYYSFPFIYKADEQPSKQQKIKKTICGFLNAQGGIIYFGIKQNTQNRQRRAAGNFFNQSKKMNFVKTILKLVKDILPDIGKQCKIKWVPVKNSKTKNFISGTYIAKVIIQRGSKSHIYSYIHTKRNGQSIEKFAFKTQNQVLIKDDAQELLKIFRNKLQQPQRFYYPIHPNPCPEPQIGKPMYDSEWQEDQKQPDTVSQKSFQVEKSNQKQYLGAKYDYSDMQEQDMSLIYEKQKKAQKYEQKTSTEFIVKGSQRNQIKRLIQDKNIKYHQVKELQSSWVYINLQKSKDINHLKSQILGQIVMIYSIISLQKLSSEQIQALNKQIRNFNKTFDQKIKRQKEDMLLFNKSLEAANFYIFVVENEALPIQFIATV